MAVLTIACKANDYKFVVRIPNGTVIQNFKGNGAIPMHAGVVRTTVNKGKVTNNYRQNKQGLKKVEVPQTSWQKLGNFFTTGTMKKTKDVPYTTVDKNLTPQSALNLSSSKYNIVHNVKGLDKNPNDLSAKDLEKLRKSPSLWKELGISSVKYDAKSYTTGIYTDKNDKNPLIIKIK